MVLIFILFCEGSRWAEKRGSLCSVCKREPRPRHAGVHLRFLPALRELLCKEEDPSEKGAFAISWIRKTKITWGSLLLVLPLLFIHCASPYSSCPLIASGA